MSAGPERQDEPPAGACAEVADHVHVLALAGGVDLGGVGARPGSARSARTARPRRRRSAACGRTRVGRSRRSSGTARRPCRRHVVTWYSPASNAPSSSMIVAGRGDRPGRTPGRTRRARPAVAIELLVDERRPSSAYEASSGDSTGRRCTPASGRSEVVVLSTVLPATAFHDGSGPLRPMP